MVPTAQIQLGAMSSSSTTSPTTAAVSSVVDLTATISIPEGTLSDMVVFFTSNSSNLVFTDDVVVSFQPDGVFDRTNLALPQFVSVAGDRLACDVRLGNVSINASSPTLPESIVVVIKAIVSNGTEVAKSNAGQVGVSVSSRNISRVDVSDNVILRVAEPTVNVTATTDKVVVVGGSVASYAVLVFGVEDSFLSTAYNVTLYDDQLTSIDQQYDFL